VHVKANFDGLAGLDGLAGTDQQAVQVMVRGTGRIRKQHPWRSRMTFNGQLGVSEFPGSHD
jgi:hypothetical protein